MGDTTEKDVQEGAAEGQHRDAARTTTESGAAAAASLHPGPSKTHAESSEQSTPRKVNAGSSDR